MFRFRHSIFLTSFKLILIFLFRPQIKKVYRKNYSLKLFSICFLPFLALSFFISTTALGLDPSVLYLTWQKDPTTSMSIQWHAPLKKSNQTLFYQEKGGENWVKVQAFFKKLPMRKMGIYQVHLENLKEGTSYFFKIGENGPVYRFCTMSSHLEDAPLRFVVGGDAFFHLNRFKKMNEEIASKDPDFVVIGGDIAYSIGYQSFFQGKRGEMKRWSLFFKEWKESMVGRDGRLIPLVVTIGNHDVPSGRINPKEEEILFYDLFPFPDRFISYRALDFGSYLSLILLDSGHTYPIKGDQLKWIERTLEERATIPYKAIVYHISAYPSYYPYDGKISRQIRELWVPLFERYGTQVVFENHNHAFKRTHPLKEGQVAPDGIVYIGDGSWGVSSRKPISASETWYLAKSAKVNCFSLVELSQEKCHIEVFDIKGQSLDEVEILPIPLVKPVSLKSG